MSATWQQKNPEKWREYKREWYQKNKDRQSEYRRSWDARHPEYFEKNKERFSKRSSEYWASNKTKMIPQSLLRAARRRSKENGLECTITIQDIVVPEVCPLLGIPLFLGDGKQGPNSPSLDRIDNSKGYIPGNVWVISHRANACKGALTPDEIIQIGMRLKEMALAEGALQ